MSEYDVHQTFLKIHQLIKNPKEVDGLADRLTKAYAIGDVERQKLEEARTTIEESRKAQAKVDADLLELSLRKTELNKNTQKYQDMIEEVEIREKTLAEQSKNFDADYQRKVLEITAKEKALEAKEGEIIKREYEIMSRNEILASNEKAYQDRHEILSQREANFANAVSLVSK